MTFDPKAYRAAWARRNRKKKKIERRSKLLGLLGKCGNCEMILTSAYHTNYPCDPSYPHTRIGSKTE